MVFFSLKKYLQFPQNSHFYPLFLGLKLKTEIATAGLELVASFWLGVY